MPLIQVNMLEGRTPDQKKAVLTGIYEAVQTALDCPAESIRVWINEFSRDEFLRNGVVVSDEG